MTNALELLRRGICPICRQGKECPGHAPTASWERESLLRQAAKLPAPTDEELQAVDYAIDKLTENNHDELHTLALKGLLAKLKAVKV